MTRSSGSEIHRVDTLDIHPANLEGKLAQMLSRDKLSIRPGGLILPSSAYSFFAVLTLVSVFHMGAFFPHLSSAKVSFLSEFVLVGLCLCSGLSVILKRAVRIAASSSTLPSSVKSKNCPSKRLFI